MISLIGWDVFKRVSNYPGYLISSMVTFPFQSHIVDSGVFFLLSLLMKAKGLSTGLLFFSRNLIVCLVETFESFVSITLILVVTFIILGLVLVVLIFFSPCPRALMCNVRLFSWRLSVALMNEISGMPFVLKTACRAYQWWGYFVLVNSLASEYI